MSRTPSTSTQEIQMDMFDHHPHTQGKYGKRKSRFKRSDGSTSSDTTSNSFVRQDHVHWGRETERGAGKNGIRSEAEGNEAKGERKGRGVSLGTATALFHVSQGIEWLTAAYQASFWVLVRSCPCF
ncbi:hypothetical protein NQZ68_005644 [Dissostichus eleginoides]|nr:hypothetical protein NQZ68_005644 [Dissostichus eleginoides]